MSVPAKSVHLCTSDEVPLVELVLATRTGSTVDAVGQEGSLALAMRSLRRGAGKRTAFAIDDEADRLGGEFSTSVDSGGATLHATVIKRNLEPFVDLLADLLLRPTFPADEIAHVLRETRADIVDSWNDDRALASRHFRRTLFAGHPLGRPPGGTLASLEMLSAESARAAFTATFTAPNLVLGASGDIDAPTLAKLAAKLGAMPDVAPPARQLTEPTVRKGRHLVVVDKPERTQTQILIGGLGTHPRDRDYFALHVANTVFGGTFTARLMREVRSKRGWSYGASSRLGRDRVRDAWSMWTFPAAKDAAACVALELRLLDELLDKGITERELAFAKSYLVKSHAFEIDTAGKRLLLLLDEDLMELPRGYHAKYLERVEAVTLEQANASLRKRLSRDNLLVSIVATASELRGPLEKSIAGLASTTVIPFDQDVLGVR